MSASEFKCPYSPDPRKPACIPGERCALVTEFQRKADSGGAKTRDLALKSDKNTGGPWYKQTRWNNIFFHYRELGCPQREFKKQRIEKIHSQKRSSGKLLLG